MIEWTFFYRALGIDEDVTHPTYYELLDISPEACDPQRVDGQLRHQIVRIRQRIPSRHFIPLVLRFEKTKLQKAASVLKDPALRLKYDRYLQEKEQTRKTSPYRQERRHKVLHALRRFLDQVLNADKTLDDHKRPALKKKLAQLGLTANQIDELVDRIPAPAPASSVLDEKVLDYFTMSVDLIIEGREVTETLRERIMNLAEKLTIPSHQATALLADKLAPADDPLVLEQDSVIEISMADIVDDQEMETLVEVDDDIQATDSYGEIAKIVLPIVVAVVILLIGLIVWLVGFRGKAASFEDQPISLAERNTSEEPYTPVVGDDAIGSGFSLGSYESKERIAESAVPITPKVDDPDPDVMVRQEPPEPNESEIVAVTKPLHPILAPQEIQAVFSADSTPIEFLSDTATLMMLSQARLLQYRSRVIGDEADLRARIVSDDAQWSTWLKARITVTPLTEIIVNNLAQEELTSITQCSIEKLMERDDEAAVDELFRRFIDLNQGARSGLGDVKRASRILYALEHMSHPDIPKRLTDRIARSGPMFAYLIVNSLGRASPNPEIAIKHSLTLNNTKDDRGLVAEWWQQNIPPWGHIRPRYTQWPFLRDRREQRRAYQPPTAPPRLSTVLAAQSLVNTLPPWLMRSDHLAILTVLQHYGQAMAKLLEADPNQLDLEAERMQLMQQPELYCDPVTVSKDLLQSYRDIYDLLRLFANRDTSQDLHIEISEIERWRLILYNGSETQLQEIFSYSYAIGDLFGLLARARLREPQDLERLEAQQADYKQRLDYCDSVVQQLRESTYYQFVMLHELVNQVCETQGTGEEI